VSSQSIHVFVASLNVKSEIFYVLGADREHNMICPVLVWPLYCWSLVFLLLITPLVSSNIYFLEAINLVSTTASFYYSATMCTKPEEWAGMLCVWCWFYICFYSFCETLFNLSFTLTTIFYRKNFCEKGYCILGTSFRLCIGSKELRPSWSW
jgi:hypothetical protein